MIIGIMQPYLFPYLGYFQLMNIVDKYVIYDDVQFMKRSWINRNNILLNNEAYRFTIQLSGASTTKNINEIEIQDDFDSFLKTISLAYAKAPHKAAVYDLVASICSYKDKNLARFVGDSFNEICAYLDINTELIYSSDIDKDDNLRAQDKVLAICEKMSADMYVNAIGGQELYDRRAFQQRGIELKFLKTLPIAYKQFGREFVPSLSIIDVLMFNSVPDVQKMLREYTLI